MDQWWVWLVVVIAIFWVFGWGWFGSGTGGWWGATHTSRAAILSYAGEPRGILDCSSLSRLSAALSSRILLRHGVVAPRLNASRTIPRPIPEKPFALFAHEPAAHWDDVIAFFKHVLTGNQARAPFVVFVPVPASVFGDVVLRNSVHHGTDPGPNARAGAHRARFVSGIQHEIRQIPPVTAGDVFQRFQFDVLDARSRSFHAIAGACNH